MSTRKFDRGIRLVTAATPRSTGLATRSVTRIGRKITPAATSALSSTGISMNRPAGGARMAGRHLERDVRPQRGAADDRPVELEVVDQRRDLVGERAHAVGAHVGGLVRGAVAEQVDGDHPQPPRRHLGRQVVVHVPVHQQPVDEHEHPLALAPVGVGDPATVVAKRPLDRRHRGESNRRPGALSRRGRAPAGRARRAPMAARPAAPRAPRGSRARG